jgi:hypothetical protein
VQNEITAIGPDETRGITMKKIGGIYFLRFYRLRFSFCIARNS